MPGPPHPCRSLSSYADGRLPGWRLVLVERHLVRCPRCAREVAQIRAVRRFLASSGDPATPPGLQERLLGIADPRPDVLPSDAPPQDVPASGGPSQDVPPSDAPPQDVPASGGPSRDVPVPPEPTEGDRPRARPLVGAVGVVAASLLVLGAAGAGALVTGMTTPAPGAPPRASLTTVLPRLLSWPPDPDGAVTVRPVDNGDRP